MPVTFVLGLPGTGKTTFCLDSISKACLLPSLPPTSSPSADRIFYIVPEQSSLQAERMLVAKSPQKAVMKAQAISFGRLAYHVFSRTGNAPVRHLNDNGKHMLLRKLLQDCGLSFYARAIHMPGFIESLAHTVTEFSQYAVLPGELELHGTKKENLRPKLMDLAAIYRIYRENIAGRYLVTGETLDLLAEALEGSDYLENGQFWIDGFNDFTPQEMKVIGRIMAAAKDVTITLTIKAEEFAETDKWPGISFSPHYSDFFYATKRTLHNLHELAQNLAIPINPPILLNKMHRFPKKVIVAPLQNKSEELTQAAKWIIRNVIDEKKWRFRDIAVLCGDLPGYEKLARNIFEPYGIPLFIDSKMGILSHPLTELIRAAIDVAVWDWQYEGIFRVLKTGFTGLSTEEIDRLENYVLARGIKSWRWRVSWEDDNMEASRLQVLEMMEPFINGIKPDSETAISGFAQRVYDWLYSLDAPGTLARLLKEATDENDLDMALRHKQIWTCIAEIFDKLTEILGEDKVSIRTFGEILDTGFKSADMGLIPPSLDQVVMGDITRSRYPEIKALWVLGANDGKLPQTPPQNSLITEEERAHLRQSGLQLAPDLPRQISDNMLALYSALHQPGEELTLSYSRSGSDGKPMRPSPALIWLRKIFAVDENSYVSERDHYPSLLHFDADVPYSLSAESIKLIYGDTFHTAASRLEAYVQCPFSYFLNYNLKAKERAIYQVRAMDLGVIYHDVIAKVTEDLTKNNAWHTIDLSQLKKAVHTYAEEVIPGSGHHILRSSARNMYILKRVENICTISLWALCEQYRRGTFSTADIESSVGDIIIPINSTKQMILTGRIDRVDILNASNNTDFIKVIDYKSGGTRFSLEEVQAGVQLQLMLYMNALLKNNPSTQPGGVFYFNISDPILTVDETPSPEAHEALLLKQFQMSGLVLSDPINVAGMDKSLLGSNADILAPGDSSIIPVSIKKDGSFSKSSSVINEKGFASLCRDVEDHVKEIGQRMIAGDISKAPYVKSGVAYCKYCRYRAACGFDKG